MSTGVPITSAVVGAGSVKRLEVEPAPGSFPAGLQFGQNQQLPVGQELALEEHSLERTPMAGTRDKSAVLGLAPVPALVPGLVLQLVPELEGTSYTGLECWGIHG